MGGGAEAAYAHIPHTGTYDVGGVDGLDGYLVAGDGERQQAGDAAPCHAEAHLCALGAAQALHYFLAGHLDACYGGVVDCHDAVAGNDAHALRRPSADGLDDEQGVFYHVELNAYALEVAGQRFVECLHFLGRGV